MAAEDLSTGAGTLRRICASAELQDGGDGVRFDIEWRGRPATGFAVRHQGRLRAYVNRCAHIPVELDWNPGKFFDVSGLYLICATHGALYLPENGLCILGPCKGRFLDGLGLLERDGQVYLLPDHP